jgi:hypothetical protein
MSSSVIGGRGSWREGENEVITANYTFLIELDDGFKECRLGRGHATVHEISCVQIFEQTASMIFDSDVTFVRVHKHTFETGCQCANSLFFSLPPNSCSYERRALCGL